MAVITHDAIPQVVAELERRKAKLYHACQLKDLRSYLQLGGVPSRNLLDSNGLPYTAFETDPGDQRKGLWKLVFFNLSDFGSPFARGSNNLPNPYGPILLCFNPRVIERANDISITLRSAGAGDFDREAEGLSAEDVPTLFRHSNGPCVWPPEELRCKFENQKARSPEMSCSFDDELAVMDCLAYIRVDPYSFDGRCLPDVVRETVLGHEPSYRVFARDRCNDVLRYQVLWDVITRTVPSGGDVLSLIGEDSLMSTWADRVRSQSKLSFQFNRYVRYLFDGTIRECVS